MSDRDTFLDKLPFGPAPCLIALMTVLAGLYLFSRPSSDDTNTLTIATFAREHRDSYEEGRVAFEAAHPGVRVRTELLSHFAMNQRLRASLSAGLEVPDLVDIEISTAGGYFRGPVDQVGLVDLRPRLEESGILHRIPEGRFAPYTHKGRIFGLPHDIHPVGLAYRRDLFEEAGIDPESIRTWDDLIRVGRQISRVAEKFPRNPRYLIQLPSIDSWGVELILFQRGGGIFDAEGNLTLDSPLVAETLRWYVPLVAGPDRIGYNAGVSGAAMIRSIEDGLVWMFVCPDWRTRKLENDAPQLAGKMAIMPLPAWEPGGRRTSTWGGTMLAITSRCRQPDMAWELVKHLYTSPEGWDHQWIKTGILPPIREAWTRPAITAPNPFWSGQRIGKLFAEMAEEVPAQHTHPFSELAQAKLGEVLSACRGYYEAHGDEGFAEFIDRSLAAAAAEVRKQMARNPF
jgi:arabinosaccharide transport system substrate-binding protein